MSQKVLYYLKLHYEFNHIKHVLYGKKCGTKKNYKYSIKKLHENIYKNLSLIKNSIILEYFRNYFKKKRFM